MPKVSDQPSIPLGKHLALNVTDQTTLREFYSYAATAEIVEQFYVMAMIKFTKGNRTEAAQRLNIAVRTLQRKLKKWGIEDWGNED